MRRQILWTVVCCASIAPVSVLGDTINVSGTLSLNFLDGKHDTGTGIDRLTFIPLPLVELDARDRRTTVHLEALPPLTFGYGSTSGGRQQTQLSIINLTLRQSFAAGVYLGIGQTIYNQRTSYPPGASSAVTSQASRVTGARLEAGVTRRAFRATEVEYVFALNPGMRGVERTALSNTQPDTLSSEKAVQVDTSLRFIAPLFRGDIVYGVRYLNYASRFDARGTPFDGLLSDRNVGFMAVLGYRAHF